MCDKGSVEMGVLQTQRALLAPLREIRFTSIADLNRALRARCDLFNRLPFQKREGSRWSVFEAEDRPALQPLPSEPFETEEWIVCRVHIDYHISHDRRLYSVPYAHVGKKVDVRVARRTIEVFYREERLASHPRLLDPRTHRHTIKAHMPPHHQGLLDKTDAFFLKQADTIGADVREFFEFLFAQSPYPPQAYRTCQGILALQKKYPPDRIARACALALAMRVRSYKTVSSILDTGSDLKKPLPPPPPSIPTHKNLRGPVYYAKVGKKSGTEVPDASSPTPVTGESPC